MRNIMDPLPNELLFCIFRQLSPKSLLKCRLVCKLWNEMVKSKPFQKTLWFCIWQMESFNEKELISFTQHSLSSVTKLEWFSNINGSLYLRKCLRNDELVCFLKKVTHLVIGGPIHPRDVPRLLGHCPNLQSLDLDKTLNNVFKKDTFFRSALKYKQYDQAREPLIKLTEFSFTCTERNDFDIFIFLASWMPDLQNLEVHTYNYLSNKSENNVNLSETFCNLLTHRMKNLKSIMICSHGLKLDDLRSFATVKNTKINKLILGFDESKANTVFAFYKLVIKHGFKSVKLVSLTYHRTQKIPHCHEELNFPNEKGLIRIKAMCAKAKANKKYLIRNTPESQSMPIKHIDFFHTKYQLPTYYLLQK